MESENQFQLLSALVVDDHAAMRKAISKVLSKMGVKQIAECNGGTQALQALSRHHYELLITDLVMSEGDGFRLIEQVRSRPTGEDIPIIVVTGDANRDNIVRASDLGADDYLLKPFQLADLEEKITRQWSRYCTPSPCVAKIREGERKLLLGQTAEALGCFQAAVSLDPNSAKALHSLAVGWIACNERAEAIRLLQEGSLTYPKYYRNFVRLADLMVQQGDSDMAARYLTQELALHPKQPSRQSLLAQIYLDREEQELALHHFREALKIDPKFKRALVGMAHCNLVQRNHEKALYYFKRIRRNYPSDTRALEQCVKLLVSKKQVKNAESLLKDEMKKNPNSPDSYILLARLCLNRHDLAGTEKILDRIYEKFSEKTPEVVEIQGNLELQSKQFEKAIETLLPLAVEKAPSSIFAALGEAYLGTGNSTMALSLLSKASSLSPKNQRVMLLIGDTYRASQQTGKSYFTYLLVAQRHKLAEASLQEKIADSLEQFLTRRPKRVKMDQVS